MREPMCPACGSREIYRVAIVEAEQDWTPGGHGWQTVGTSETRAVEFFGCRTCNWKSFDDTFPYDADAEGVPSKLV